MALRTPYSIDRATIYKGDVIKTNLSLAIRLIDDFTKKESIGRIKVIIKEGNKVAIKNPSRYYVYNDLEDGTYTVNIMSDFYFPEERIIDISKTNTLNSNLKFYTEGPAPGATTTELLDTSRLQKGEIVEFCNLQGDMELRKILSVDVATNKISWAGELKYNFTGVGCTIRTENNHVISVYLKPRCFYPFSDDTTLVRGLFIDLSENPVVDARVIVANYEIETKSDNSGELVLYFNKIHDKNILIEIETNGHKQIITTDLEEWVNKYLGKIVIY